MNLQFITDINGHKSGVLLTLHDWEKIQKELEELERLREKKFFMTDLKEAVEEVKLAKQGKIKLQSGKDFLNEL
ncbi:MAG: hypothetical protein HY738_09210 [Bacteroidia bacterium]|nr:hypothetical protein [Bacteroidia bacterium]